MYMGNRQCHTYMTHDSERVKCVW